jgi:hypothetical protein
MYFLFSGEGATDFGVGRGNAVVCEGSFYESGPMAVIVDQITAAKWGCSLLGSPSYGFVREHTLADRASELKNASRKSFRLPGKKQARETAYFYENSRVLALCAKEQEDAIGDEVIAVLFRDSDGTSSAGRGLWPDKWNSMISGFEREEFDRGVPMIPRPKSEAWVICALKKNRYQGCDVLEDRSGNDKSPKSLKRELRELHGHLPSREELCEMVADRTIDIDKIQMPSFQAFRDRLELVLKDN